MTANKKITILLSVILTQFLYSCVCHKSTHPGVIHYKNGATFNKNICIKRNSYFAYVMVKDDNQNKFEKIYPELVQSVYSDEWKLVSLFFSEDKYGVDSHAFAKIIAGDIIKLVYATYQINTCNCKGKNMYVSNYFLINDNEKLLLNLNDDEIVNKYEVVSFIKNRNGLNPDIDKMNIKLLSDILNN